VERRQVAVRDAREHTPRGSSIPRASVGFLLAALVESVSRSNPVSRSTFHTRLADGSPSARPSLPPRAIPSAITWLDSPQTPGRGSGRGSVWGAVRLGGTGWARRVVYSQRESVCEVEHVQNENGCSYGDGPGAPGVVRDTRSINFYAATTPGRCSTISSGRSASGSSGSTSTHL
jgi:hypothetical protein